MLNNAGFMLLPQVAVLVKYISTMAIINFHNSCHYWEIKLLFELRIIDNRK